MVEHFARGTKTPRRRIPNLANCSTGIYQGSPRWRKFDGPANHSLSPFPQRPQSTKFLGTSRLSWQADLETAHLASILHHIDGLAWRAPPTSSVWNTAHLLMWLGPTRLSSWGLKFAEIAASIRNQQTSIRDHGAVGK